MVHHYLLDVQLHDIELRTEAKAANPSKHLISYKLMIQKDFRNKEALLILFYSVEAVRVLLPTNVIFDYFYAQYKM